MRLRLAFLFLLLLLCGGTPAQSLLVSGSTTIGPLLGKIAEHYMQEHPGYRIEVSGGGSAAGIQALLNGRNDIAMSSRFIDQVELQQANRRSVYPVPFHFAHDAIVPVVHPRNPLRSLSLEQIRQIYFGQIKDWQELGGAPGRISVICRDANSGTQAVWNQMGLAGHRATACTREEASNLAVLQAVRNDHQAIGYISLAYLSANARVRPLRVDGEMATPDCVRMGCYPLTRSLFLFTRGWPEKRLLHFINYALHSPQARQVILDAGLTPAH